MLLSLLRGGTVVAWGVLDGGNFVRLRQVSFLPTTSACRSSASNTTNLAQAPFFSRLNTADALFVESMLSERSRPTAACTSTRQPTGSSDLQPLQFSVVLAVGLQRQSLLRSSVLKKIWVSFSSTTKSSKWRWRVSRQCCKHKLRVMLAKPRVKRQSKRKRRKSKDWRLASHSLRPSWPNRRRLFKSWKRILQLRRREMFVSPKTCSSRRSCLQSLRPVQLRGSTREDPVLCRRRQWPMPSWSVTPSLQKLWLNIVQKWQGWKSSWKKRGGCVVRLVWKSTVFV
mmetsp:Transcript_13171/g.28795  ORF Transcript_13171/g.28795 Transcript_13171/m.28795 type:complete len:284 (-) Transcript_13171:1545-2396(-)